MNHRTEKFRAATAEAARIARKQVNLAIRLANDAFGDDPEFGVLYGRLADISASLIEVENQEKRIERRLNSAI